MNIDRVNYYHKDIDIAKAQLNRLMLLPENVIADYYCLPPYIHQTIYVVVSRAIEDNTYDLTYIKPVIYAPGLNEPTRSCTFAECETTESHKALQGQFIAGVKKINARCIDELYRMLMTLPKNFAYHEDKIFIDGIVQGIHFYDKELLYIEAKYIPGLSDKQNEVLDNLYIKVGNYLGRHSHYLS